MDQERKDDQDDVFLRLVEENQMEATGLLRIAWSSWQQIGTNSITIPVKIIF